MPPYAGAAPFAPGIPGKTPLLDLGTPGVDRDTPGVDSDTLGVEKDTPAIEDGVERDTVGIERDVVGRVLCRSNNSLTLSLITRSGSTPASDMT